MSALIEYFENRDVLHVILSTKFEDSKTGPTYNNQDSFATPFFEIYTMTTLQKHKY